MKIKYVSVSVSVSCLVVNANRLKLPRIQGGVNLPPPRGLWLYVFFVGHRVPYTHIVAQSWELVRFGPKG